MEIGGKSTDGPVSRYINRRVSTRITRFIVAHGLPITPNQVSLLSMLLAVAGGAAFLYGVEWLGGLLVEIASIVDGVDGELARARGVASPVGGFVDAVLDRFADAAIIAGIVVAYYPSMGIQDVAVGLAALLGDLMVSYLHARGEASLGIHPSRIGRIPLFASRDVRLFILFLGGLLGAAFTALYLVSAISLAYVALKTAEIYVLLGRASRGG